MFREQVRDSFIDCDQAALAVAWPFGVVIVLPVILSGGQVEILEAVERPNEIELIALERTQEILVSPPRDALALRPRRHIGEPEMNAHPTRARQQLRCRRRKIS